MRLAEVGKVTLKSDSNEVLSNEPLLKSSSDEVLSEKIVAKKHYTFQKN
jgi:hypothetical protein